MEPVWHGHHDSASPLEFIYSIENRINFIKQHKPVKEIQRRLALLKPVEGGVSVLPLGVQKAAIAEENDELEWEEMLITLVNNEEEILALHKTQCGCGWTPEQTNIFKYLP